MLSELTDYTHTNFHIYRVSTIEVDSTFKFDYISSSYVPRFSDENATIALDIQKVYFSIRLKYNFDPFD